MNNNEEATREVRPKRLAFAIAFAIVMIVHLLLTFYVERPRVVFSSDPISWLDFDTHIGQVWRVTEALDGWGKSWAYDPQLLAGHPNGIIFNADNKGWELWTFALWKLGLPKGLAFNMFILLSHLLVPWVVFASARLFRLDRWAALLAMTLGMSIWFFDGFPRWCTWIGMTSWAMAGYLSLLPIALLYRFLDDGKAWRAAACAVVLAAGHLVHPYTFAVAALPMGAMYVRSFRQISIRRHVGVWSIAAFTVAANAYWLIVALQFWHYILDSGYCFQGGVGYLLTDYLGLIGADPLVSGVLSNRTAFRLIGILGSIITLYFWKKKRDDRFLPFAVALGATFAVTYLGSYVWLTKQVQPYRFILPAIFLTVIPGASFLARAIRSESLRKLPRPAYVVMGIMLFVTVPALARDVLYFFPAFLPSLKPLHEVMPVPTGDQKVFGKDLPGAGFHKQMDFRHEPHYQDMNDVTRFLIENDDGQGRVLVEWYVLGEHLAWRTRSQILGGFHERNLMHTVADLFRRDEDGDLPTEELRRYFEDYAVKWVIMTSTKKLEDNSDLIEPLGGIPPYDDKGIPRHRVYKTKVPVSFFAVNDGRVEASMNRLEVTGTRPDEDVVLRYHWLETLVCEDDACVVEREPIEHDPVGFIRVPAPHPSDFVIVNGY